MISTDKLVFNPESQVRARLISLASRVDLLEVIVFTKQRDNFLPVTDQKLILHPTNSLSVFNYIFDTIKIGKKLTGINLITCQDPFLTGWVGLRLARKFKVKLELQLHTDVLSSAFRQFNFKNRVYYWLAKFILPYANQVRVVSDKLKESLVTAKLVKLNQIYVLPIFTDFVTAITPAWVTLIPRDYKVILMVGRLEGEKRFDLALQAFKLLADKKTILVIAGDGHEELKIKKLVNQLDLNERVILTGRLTPSELAGSYQAAQVLLHTAAYEGYGLVLAEAAQVGLPIVSTDVGIAHEVGALITPSNPKAIAIALNTQLQSPKPSIFKPITSEVYFTDTINRWQTLVNR